MLDRIDHEIEAGAAKPPRNRHEARSSRSDARMVAEAIKLLASGGDGAVTLAAVGERAGYSRGLITRRYGSKSGLLARVLDVLTERSRERVVARVGNSVGVEAVELVIDLQCDLIRHHPDEIRAQFLLWFHGLDPGAEFRPNLLPVHRTQRKQVRKWIEGGQANGTLPRDQNPHRLAELVLGLLTGIIYQWLVDPNLPVVAMHEDLKQRVRILLQTPVG